MGLLDIGQAFAALDNFKRRVGLLMSDPSTTAQQNTQGMLANITSMARNSANAAHDMSSVVPEVAQQGQEQLTRGLLGYGPQMTVYHGSPHLFDKFDASKIGTGEGAQAYGHGIYFAENPDVAGGYAGTLAAQKASRDAKPQEIFAAQLLDKGWRDSGIDALIRNRFGPDAVPGVIEGAKKYQAAKAGNTYKVDLPDEQVAKMLHWDAPMTEQPSAIRDLLHTPGQNDAQTGAQLYHDLSLSLGGRDVAAEKLRSWGIPGIKYLDQGSRKSGEGTSNFVVFPGSEGLLSILGRE